MSGDIQFQNRDFVDLTNKRTHGCVIGNPPYGERIGEKDEVQALYRAMPEVLRRLKTWSHYFLTSHPYFEELVGQPADRRRKLFNGRIECTFYQFYGPKPEKNDTGSTPKAVQELCTENREGEAPAEPRVARGSAGASPSQPQKPFLTQGH